MDSREIFSAVDPELFNKITNGEVPRKQQEPGDDSPPKCDYCDVPFTIDVSQGRYICDGCGYIVNSMMDSDKEGRNYDSMNGGLIYRSDSAKTQENNLFKLWCTRNEEINSPIPQHIIRKVAQMYPSFMKNRIPKYDDNGIKCGMKRLSGKSSRLTGFVIILFQGECARDGCGATDIEISYIACGKNTTSSVNRGMRVVNALKNLGFEMNTTQDNRLKINQMKKILQQLDSDAKLEMYGRFIVDIINHSNEKGIGNKKEERSQVGGCIVLLRTFLGLDFTDDKISELCKVKFCTLNDFAMIILRAENFPMFSHIFKKYNLIEFDDAVVPAVRSRRKISITGM